MKVFLAATAATLFFPMAAFAAGQWEARTCTVAQIQGNVGICSKVELPTPARDVRICVRSKTATQTSKICEKIAAQSAASASTSTTTTTAGLGGLAGAGPAVLVLVVGAALAGSGGGGNTPGTN